MPIDPHAAIIITAFDWVPEFARGHVRDLRPRWLCEELGLAYRERLISALHRPDWYFSEQPWGQVPHVRDGAIDVFESGATLIHLAERHDTPGGLLPPGGQERASVLSWTLAAFNSVEPLAFEWGQVSLFSAREDWAKLRRPSLLEDLGKRLDRLDRALDGREWLCGAFSIADIAMVTVLHAVEDTHLLEQHPTLTDYLDRGRSRPAYQAALTAQLVAFAAAPTRSSVPAGGE